MKDTLLRLSIWPIFIFPLSFLKIMKRSFKFLLLFQFSTLFFIEFAPYCLLYLKYVPFFAKCFLIDSKNNKFKISTFFKPLETLYKNNQTQSVSRVGGQQFLAILRKVKKPEKSFPKSLPIKITVHHKVKTEKMKG
jgi:hypothetical protein